MTIARPVESALGQGRDALSITLSAGWRRVHAERLLDDMTNRASSVRSNGATGTSAQQGVNPALGHALELYRDQQIVFTAMRMRSDVRAIDQMILALPSRSADAPLESADGGDGQQRWSELTEDVDVRGLRAVSHRSQVGEIVQGRENSGSVVQLVFVVSGSDRGAILTMMSSAIGDEELLERDAEDIAASVRIVGGDEAQRAATSVRITR